MKDSDTETIRGISLDACVQASNSDRGIMLAGLQRFQDVWLHTRNHPYSLLVLDPIEGRVLIRGGNYFPDYREGFLCGSSWGGSILRSGWIGLGMCLEFYVDGLRVVTTPVRSLRISDPEASPASIH